MIGRHVRGSEAEIDGHKVCLERSWDPDVGVQAVYFQCSCGKSGRWRYLSADARRDAVRHLTIHSPSS